ncbi:hypothetical protein J7T55_013088 [Diaporthe amygdali]|uniref:uncharacterized protein n=1 Tax=Phomopsis amygdali TaxID=1214568 RepID=UPI0022FEA077|nr:uncharacterized protein J7T55_013088 [Diaporthe amygdali]KAJ0118832.1 hypothetical protein J7T55_013088 [Diaporthe amygdali]
MDMLNMASIPMNIDDLPSEILMQILSPMTTIQLLPLARVNRRFHDLAIRLIHTRLTNAAFLPEHELILECYHPSAKISTPYLQCNYLGTDGLSGYEEDHQLSFGQFGQLYSRFRPVLQEDNRRSRSRHPSVSGGAAEGDDTATVTVDLDDGEMFSQLCTVTNMVKNSSRRGLFLSHVNINDGVVRVFRRWLRQCHKGELKEQDQILWTDRQKNVGLRFKVRENVGARPGPAIWTQADEDEDLPVSYELEYQEVLVRTGQLLLKVEKAEDQEVHNTDLGFVRETGSKVPCKGQQMYFWMPPANTYDRQLWGGSAPSIWSRTTERALSPSIATPESQRVALSRPKTSSHEHGRKPDIPIFIRRKRNGNRLESPGKT